MPLSMNILHVLMLQVNSFLIITSNKHSKREINFSIVMKMNEYWTSP
jgi:hypothetical protein